MRHLILLICVGWLGAASQAQALVQVDTDSPLDTTTETAVTTTETAVTTTLPSTTVATTLPPTTVPPPLSPVQETTESAVDEVNQAVDEVNQTVSETSSSVTSPDSGETVEEVESEVTNEVESTQSTLEGTVSDLTDEGEQAPLAGSDTSPSRDDQAYYAFRNQPQIDGGVLRDEEPVYMGYHVETNRPGSQSQQPYQAGEREQLADEELEDSPGLLERLGDFVTRVLSQALDKAGRVLDQVQVLAGELLPDTGLGVVYMFGVGVGLLALGLAVRLLAD